MFSVGEVTNAGSVREGQGDIPNDVVFEGEIGASFPSAGETDMIGRFGIGYRRYDDNFYFGSALNFLMTISFNENTPTPMALGLRGEIGLRSSIGRESFLRAGIGVSGAWDFNDENRVMAVLNADLGIILCRSRELGIEVTARYTFYGPISSEEYFYHSLGLVMAGVFSF